MGSATRGHCGNRSYPLRNQLERKQLCMIVGDSVSERANELVWDREQDTGYRTWCRIQNLVPDTEPGSGYRTWERVQNLMLDT